MENKSQKIYDQTLEKIKRNIRIPLLKIIRLKCLDCVCWQESEVRLCPADDCILWAFRMGKNPVPKRMSETQKKALQKARLLRMGKDTT